MPNSLAAKGLAEWGRPVVWPGNERSRVLESSIWWSDVARLLFGLGYKVKKGDLAGIPWKDRLRELHFGAHLVRIDLFDR